MSEKEGKTYQEYSKFLETTFMRPEVAKLCEVSPLDTFNEEMNEILEAFYKNHDSAVKMLGSIFNSIYTQHNNVFLLSVGIVRDLVAADAARHKLTSCNGKSYNFIIHHCLMAGMFVKIREQVGKKAALYELVHPKFLDPLYRVMSKEMLAAKKKRTIEWYDSTDLAEVEDKQPKQERVLTEEQKKARETADAIFKRK